MGCFYPLTVHATPWCKLWNRERRVGDLWVWRPRNRKSKSNGRTKAGWGEEGGVKLCFSFCHTGINELWDNYEGCDLISSFSRAMLTSPSAQRNFLSVEAKGDLPPSFLGVRWNREAGGTAGQDWPAHRVSWSRCRCGRSSGHPTLTASSLWLMVASWSARLQPLPG